MPATITERETKGEGGRREIALVRDGELFAVVTRPCSGAKWRLHRFGDRAPMGVPFPTRAAAIEAALPSEERNARRWDAEAAELERMAAKFPNARPDVKERFVREAEAARAQAAWWRSGKP